MSMPKSISRATYSLHAIELRRRLDDERRQLKGKSRETLAASSKKPLEMSVDSGEKPKEMQL